MTGTGSVDAIVRDDDGGWTMHLDHGKARCFDRFMFIESNKPFPASCVKGSSVTARFSVQDALVDMTVKELLSVNCQ